MVNMRKEKKNYFSTQHVICDQKKALFHDEINNTQILFIFLE